MKTIRFWMAVLVMVGLGLACFKHIRVVPAMLRAECARRGQVLQDNLFGHLHWVNLSGGFARCLGHRRCNEVYLAPNGMLVKLEERCPMGPIAANMIACARALDKTGCQVVYVQMPCKQSLDGQGVPAEIGEDFANENRDEILSLLRSEMRTVDLRPVVSATAQDVRENFIRTDHHWNFEGAFKSFRHLVPILLEELGVKNDIGRMSALDRANWRQVGLPRQGARFLGTSARRTGTWFAGYDQLSYLIPNFPTDLRVSTVDRFGKVHQAHGDFSDALLNWADMRDPPTYVEDYGYNVYLGDMAFVEIINPSAPVGKSVFFVKNSMSQPLLAWMSTVFVRVVAVDPRYQGRSFLRGRFLDDVQIAKPDIVVNAFERCRLDYYR